MMTRKLRRFYVGGAAALAVMAGMAGTVGAAPAGQDQGVAPVQAPPVNPDTRLTLVVYDVDLRAVLKLVFDAYGHDYSLAPEVQGNVAVAMTDQTLATAVQSLLRASMVPLTGEFKNRIWMISAVNPGKNAPVQLAGSRTEAVTPEAQPEARTILEVPRRVAAVLLLPGREGAILVNGPENSQEARTRVVKVGDKVPAGITGLEPLTVTKIDTTGVELTQAGPEKVSFTVALGARRRPLEKPEKY